MGMNIGITDYTLGIITTDKSMKTVGGCPIIYADDNDDLQNKAMLMAKNGVDGVYSDDPKTNPNAKKYDKITYDDIIVNGLKVMDLTSCALCKQNNIPICVFDFNLEDSLIKILNKRFLKKRFFIY